MFLIQEELYDIISVKVSHQLKSGPVVGKLMDLFYIIFAAHLIFFMNYLIRTIRVSSKLINFIKMLNLTHSSFF